MNVRKDLSTYLLSTVFAGGLCLGGLAAPGPGYDDSDWENPGWTTHEAVTIKGTIGVWDDVMDWPLEAIHAIHLPLHQNIIGPEPQTIGNILIFSYGDNPPPHVWNPETGKINPTDPVAANVFCSGHALLSDGTPLVAGGAFIPDAFLFDYTSGDWIQVADMRFDRFYPTCTTLPNGDILTISGYADLPEIYVDEADEWIVLPESASMPFGQTYPLTYLVPDGTIVTVGSTDGPLTETYVFNLDTFEWMEIAENFFPAGSAAMYMPGEILTSGGGGFSPTDQASIIDMNPGLLPVLPSWEEVKPMRNARTNHDLTILADGSVLAVGGTDENWDSVLQAELYLPSRKDWKLMASMGAPRNYHSTTILLGDGRVLAAGGSHPYTAQVYSPPYLFWGDRPTLGKVPKSVGYDESFAVKTGKGEAPDIVRVALVGLGAVTHSNDMNQRYVPLKYDVGDDSTLKVQSPGGPTIAPRGVYMMFIISSDGVPSIAQYIRLD